MSKSILIDPKLKEKIGILRAAIIEGKESGYIDFDPVQYLADINVKYLE